ncbi:MAG TPA: F0F1 ATP synthase subunit delta [Chloroflexia bacterium]|nr:F0F1 ATP synthase subunit delta [Chloroflexia bacterium]
MALRGTAARRYAQAVFDIGKETGTLDRWLSDLKVISSVFGDANAIATLEDPKLTEDDQRKLVSQHLPKELVSELATNLLLLLVQRGRLALLPRILEIFQQMYNKERGVIVADVTTAVPLDDAHRQRVTEQLSRITGGKTIELRLHEDPSILGGIITRIGDELIDASVAARLAELSERLS